MNYWIEFKDVRALETSKYEDVHIEKVSSVEEAVDKLKRIYPELVLNDSWNYAGDKACLWVWKNQEDANKDDKAKHPVAYIWQQKIRGI